MSTRFDVDFSEALRQLAEFQLRMNNMGHALDNMEKKSGKPATAAKRLMKDVADQFDTLERKLKAAGAASEELGKVTDSARRNVAGTLANLAAQNLKLTVQADAYAGKLKEVERLLGDSSAKSSFIKWAEKTRNLTNELVGQNKFLEASLKSLDTAEGKHNEVLKTSLATKRFIVTADVRQQAENLKLRASEAELNTALAQGMVVRRAKLSAAKSEITETTRLSAKLGELRRAYQGLDGGIQSQIALQQTMNQGLAAASTFRQREQNQVDELRRRHDSLNGGLAEQVAQLKILNQAREKEITELTRERVKIEELTRTLASLNGGEQEQIAKLNARIAARRRAIAEDQQSIAVVEELTKSAARLIVADERHKATLEAKNRATLEQARSQQRMTKEEAEALAKTEALVAANKRHSDALMDEARKTHGMSKAQLELSRAREREIEKLTRLKAQKDLLSSGYGRELASVRAQIVEQQRYNRMLSMTTAELLGFASAQRAANASMSMGGQSAAMLRAGLAGLHTSIGMYTSSTILAASATYAIASALRSAVTVGAEFTASIARSNAIMSSAQPFWMQDTGNMAAMEKQVRALGQSTIYTASEVADGLTELGMAGLSASDSITALRPSLDLATIGGINMAQSADIATNVMMTFGMQAKDLGDIVDVMATAVVSSNTNITQLANALTYAGPAAHTAGVSMKDTVAAIEALANSGIKASRSGTALRRMFVSLLNPTKKGTEMMTQYGISVLDADGKTRGLVDIIGQLNTKLKDVSGAERLSAIQDLVGVYATSPIAALVDQADNLAQLRRGLDDVAGAAERMRDKISEGLKYDWKEVISSFEEVKLAAFDNVEGRLRLGAATLSKSLIDLTVPLKDGDSLTQLDLILARAESTAVALAQMVGGILAFKFASGNVASAFAADTKSLGEGLSILSARAAATGASMQSLALHTAGSSAAMRTQATLASGSAMALSAFSTSAAVASGWLSKLAVGASVLMRALGWVGLLYGIGSALATVFGTDTEEAARAQKEKVDELKASYDKLKESIMGVALAKERDALKDQIEAEKKSIEQTEQRKAYLPGLIEDGKRQGLDTGLLESEYAGLDRQISRYKTNIENAEAALSRLKTTEADRLSLTQQQEQLIIQAGEAEKRYNDALLEYEAKREAHGNLAYGKEKVDELKAAWEALTSAAKKTSSEAEKLESRLVTLREVAAADLLTSQSAAATAAMEKEATAAEKLIALQRRRAAVQVEIDALAAKDEQALKDGEPKNRPGQDSYNRLNQERNDLLAKEAELYSEVADNATRLADAQDALAQFHMTDEQLLADLEVRLENVVALRAEYNLLKGTSFEGTYDELEAERLKAELQLLQQIKQLRANIEQKNKPKGGKSEAEKAAREAEQALKAAESTYESLRQRFDPLGASLEDTQKKTEQLQLLMDKGKISADNKAKALEELAKAHHQLTLEQDKNYQSLQALRESYGTSPFSETLDDMIELNRLYREGAVSLEEYGRLSRALKTSSAESALNGAPTAPIGLSDSASTPFGEWASTEMERAQGLSWYSNRETELGAGYDLDKINIANAAYEQEQALNALKLADQEEHARRLLEIEDQKNQALLSAQQKFTDQSTALDQSRIEYGEQAGKLALISMMNSAEGLLGQFASVAEGATTAQKAAFVAQKALAIAQILMYTHLAAAQAMAIPGDTTKVLGMSLASFITAQGYASAGLVAALAIGQLSGGGSGGSGSYAGAYDKGGVIPYGQYGIVGEYGPEIVQGPAHVTGREATAKKLGGGGGEYAITLAPQIVVQVVEDAGGDAAGRGKEVADMVKGVVMSTLVEQTRPNGALDNWIRNRTA